MVSELPDPIGLRVQGRTETSLNLAWDPAEGDFDQYVLSCEGAEVGCPSPIWLVDRDVGENSSVTDLWPGAQYTFTLGIHSATTDGEVLTTRTCK